MVRWYSNRERFGDSPQERLQLTTSWTVDAVTGVLLGFSCTDADDTTLAHLLDGAPSGVQA